MAFKAKLSRVPGAGGWYFAKVPKKHAPPVTHGWGRTPVTATVDGKQWDTSVWWDTKSQSTLLAVPRKIRGDKDHGDTVTIEIVAR
jgi:hypothetical protein